MIKIKFEIDKTVYQIDNINYSYSPSTLDNIIASVSLNISIKSQKMDQLLLDWCLSGSEQKDIKVSIFHADENYLMKTIAFKNAKCISFNESFYPTDGYNPYPINISIVAEDVSVELNRTA
jgi:Hemolysin coregulated protein Hcp (TssD)